MNNQELEVLAATPSDNNEQPRVERMGGEVYVQAGNYCVALEDIQTTIRGEHSLIKKGDALLISSLNLAHELIHSVTVKPHPRYYATPNTSPTYYQFLFEDFCDKFRVISTVEGNAIRQLEMKQLQDKVNEKQTHLFAIQSDPQRMSQIVMDIYSRRIEHKDTPSFITPNGEVNAVDVIEAGISPAMIESLRDSATQYRDLLTIQNDWLLEKQNEIRTLFEAIMPYGLELASAQQASTQEISRDLNKRYEGIETLELYVGKNVITKQITEGEPAASSEKLTVVQERLFADVELSLFTEEAVYFDARKKQMLWDNLANNPAFVNQIFPTERCVVLMACNANTKEYGNIFENLYRNEQNATVFLLVRNGQNIHVVYSPISTHLHAARLFPSKEQIEKHLYSDRNKININIDDLEYSSRMELIEQEILHFKRFILLIAGLDHREQMFGNFYPPSEMLTIFYPEFQNKYMNFIHDADGEGMLPTQEEHRPSLRDYCIASNSRMTKGSRVVINTRSLIDEDSAPSCYTKPNRGDKDPYQFYEPEEEYIATCVQLDAKGYYVKIPVRHSWDSSKRQFEARVAIPAYADMRSILCLDTLLPDDLQFYINSRKYRREFASYIGLFGFAKKYIIEQYHGYESLIEYLEEAISHIPDAEMQTERDKQKVVFETLSTWFSANNGYPLVEPEGGNKNIYDSLLLQLNFRTSPKFRAQYIDYALKALKDTPDVAPLRLSVDYDNNLWVYSTLAANERLDAIERNIFVLRSQLVVTKTGRVSLKKASEVLLDQYKSTEYVIHTWNEAAPYADLKPQDQLFINYQEKNALLDVLDDAPNLLRNFFTGDFTLEQAKLLLEGYMAYFKKETRQNRNYVPTPRFYLPFLVARSTVYAFRVEDAGELYNYLMKKFDLREEMLEKHEEILKPNYDNTAYSAKLSLASFTLTNYKGNHFIQQYKARFKQEHFYSQYLSYRHESLGSEILSDYEGQDSLTHALYTLHQNLKVSRGWNEQPLTASMLMVREDAYTKFELDDLINYQDFRFDKMFNNPLYSADWMRQSANTYLYAALCPETNEIKDTLLLVTVIAHDNNVAVEKTKELLAEFEEHHAKDNIKKSSWGMDTLYSFKDVERMYAEKFKNIDKAFFSEEKNHKMIADAAGMSTNLSDLHIIYEQDGAFIFSNKK